MWLLCSEAENADRGPKARRAGPAQVPRHRPRRQSQQTRRDEEAPPPPACPGLHVTCRTRKQSLHPRASSATYSPRLQAPRSRTRTCWAAHPLLEATGTDDHEPDAKTSRIYCCDATGPAVPRQRLRGERVRCPCPCRGPPPRSGVHALPPGPTRTTQAQPPRRPSAGWRCSEVPGRDASVRGAGASCSLHLGRGGLCPGLRVVFSLELRVRICSPSAPPARGAPSAQRPAPLWSRV